MPSKRPSHQRDKHTTGYLEKVGKEQSHDLAESRKDGNRTKPKQAFIDQGSVKRWDCRSFWGSIASKGKEGKDSRAQRGREEAFL